jgi:hypothetical protein
MFASSIISPLRGPLTCSRTHSLAATVRIGPGWPQRTGRLHSAISGFRVNHRVSVNAQFWCKSGWGRVVHNTLRTSSVFLRPATAVVKSTAWQIAEELRRPFRSKDFLELEIAIISPEVRLEDIDGFAHPVFKTTKDGILLLMFARWDR